METENKYYISFTKYLLNGYKLVMAGVTGLYALGIYYTFNFGSGITAYNNAFVSYGSVSLIYAIPTAIMIAIILSWKNHIKEHNRVIAYRESIKAGGQPKQ